MYSHNVAWTSFCKFIPQPCFGKRFGVLGPANYSKKPRRHKRVWTHGIARRFDSSIGSRDGGLGLGRKASYIVAGDGFRQLFDIADENGEDGPIELPQEWNPFEVPDANPLQTAASVLLTGALTFFLYRSLKRRAQRTKEKRFRSSGAQSVREEGKAAALKALKDLKNAQEVKARAPPSAIQALLGGIFAGVIAVALYNLTITVEEGLSRQALSTNYSIRQITITIRTIVNGLCYLATFVFAVNSIGLTLYSGQLALNFWMNIFAGGSSSTPKDAEVKDVNVEAKDDSQ